MANRAINTGRLSSRAAALIALAAFAAAGWAEGGAPIPIYSFDDLRRIGREGAYPLDAEYELVYDIDAADSRVRPFEPIGDNRNPFIGRFYGRGGNVFVVRNLYINNPAYGHVGLFGVVGYEAEVAGVGVAADTIAGGYAVGALAGTNNGRIENCYGTGVVVAGRGESNAGGLVGVNSGVIYRSYSAARVVGRRNVGGLVGLLTVSSAAGEVSQCFAVGGASGSDFVGGLVGQAFGGRVGESFAAGRVAGDRAGSVVGGLIGRDFGGSPAWSDRGVFEIDGVSGYVGAASVSASFWDKEASGVRVSAGGAGKSGAEMRSRRTFAGWDFDGVWGMADGEHYPQIAKMPFYTRKIVYAVDDEECGRLAVLPGAGGIAEMYRYDAGVMPGAGGFEVAAAPWGGCRFVGWSDGVKEARRVDVALRDTVFTAMFERSAVGAPPRVYRYEAGEGGSLRASGVSGLAVGVDTAVARGGGPVVAASPDSGYRFARWSDGVRSVARADTAPKAAAPMAVFVKDNSVIIPIKEYDDLFFIGKWKEEYPLDGTYGLSRDIDMAGRGFEPIGSAGAPFTGVFMGNGHKISGLSLASGGDFRGLFACVENAVVRGVYVEGSVVGGDGVGVLAGMCINSVIDGCAVGGAARGSSGVGGLVGRSVGSLISRSYSTARVEGSGSDAGGLVGSASGSFLALCYSAGGVNGAGFAGGAVGRAAGGQAQHCYSSGSVAGGGAVGGFAGAAMGGARLFQSYSSGVVSGVGVRAGGFVGTLGGDSVAGYKPQGAGYKARDAGYGAAAAGGGAVLITGCYWDAERSGKAASAGGIGRAAADMARRGTYAGWDFAEVWDIDDGRGYPWLRGLAPESASGALPEQKRVPAAATAKPLAMVVGRTIRVNARPGASVRIALIDMRGKVVARYGAVGAAKLPIGDVPSGRYVVEARESGGRVSVSRAGILK